MEACSLSSDNEVHPQLLHLHLQMQQRDLRPQMLLLQIGQLAFPLRYLATMPLLHHHLLVMALNPVMAQDGTIGHDLQLHLLQALLWTLDDKGGEEKD